MKTNAPKVGDKIYVDTELYVSHGVDDFKGGLATVSKVEKLKFGAEPGTWVEIKENPGSLYNWDGYLSEIQDELKKKFGDQTARLDPDPRPEMNTDL